jgi:hypothetical protein
VPLRPVAALAQSSGEPGWCACVHDDAADLAEVGDDGKQDGAHKPLGTYADPFLALDGFPAGTRFPLISMLVLRSDRTFLRTQVLGCDGTSECTRTEEEGTFRFTASGDDRFIRFLGQDGTLLDRWQYKLATESGALQVRPAGSASPWQPLPSSGVAFCTAPIECTMQGLKQPGCAGAWSCERNACEYACDDGGEPSPPQSACVAAGGTCMGLVPGACADGIILDPDDYSCGGPVGVLCCL